MTGMELESLEAVAYELSANRPVGRCCIEEFGA